MCLIHLDTIYRQLTASDSLKPCITWDSWTTWQSTCKWFQYFFHAQWLDTTLPEWKARWSNGLRISQSHICGYEFWWDSCNLSIGKCFHQFHSISTLLGSYDILAPQKTSKIKRLSNPDQLEHLRWVDPHGCSSRRVHVSAGVGPALQSRTLWGALEEYHGSNNLGPNFFFAAHNP